mgnify:CR=1 FL=1
MYLHRRGDISLSSTLCGRTGHEASCKEDFTFNATKVFIEVFKVPTYGARVPQRVQFHLVHIGIQTFKITAMHFITLACILVQEYSISTAPK